MYSAAFQRSSIVFPVFSLGSHCAEDAPGCENRGDPTPVEPMKWGAKPEPSFQQAANAAFITMSPHASPPWNQAHPVWWFHSNLLGLETMYE